MSLLNRLRRDVDEGGYPGDPPPTAQRPSAPQTPGRHPVPYAGVDGENQGRQTKLEEEGFFSQFTPVTLALVSASLVALLLVCVLALLWLRTRRRRQKLLHDLTFEDGSEESRSTKSLPPSRSPSPKLSKRASCPDALAINAGRCARGMLSRSLTTDRIPDFTLPPERVQPGRPADKRRFSFNFSTASRNNNLGSITPDFYHHPSFSEDDEPHVTESAHGRLWFSLVYDAAVEQLHVTLVKVKDLPGRSNGPGPRDPFVKMFLLPDERTCRVSKVKKKTLNPVFNETHTFQVPPDHLASRVLRFSVYDVDRRRVRHSLGHVMINLKNIDLTRGEVMWSDLEPMVQASSSLGDLQFSLVYLPSNEKIKVGVHRAKNLNYMDNSPDVVSYVRIQLHYAHKCHRVKRTISRQAGSDIMFNESLTFTVNGRQMDSCNLVIAVMLSSPNVYGPTDLEYGRVVVGPFMYSRGEELVHWQEMMSQPKTATTKWHMLTSASQPSP